ARLGSSQCLERDAERLAQPEEVVGDRPRDELERGGAVDELAPALADVEQAERDRQIAAPEQTGAMAGGDREAAQAIDVGEMVRALLDELLHVPLRLARDLFLDELRALGDRDIVAGDQRREAGPP